MFWHEQLDHSVLRAEIRAVPCRFDAFDVRQFGDHAVVLIDTGGERLSISDGWHRIRIDALSGTFLEGPVTLRFSIDDDAYADTQLRALGQFRSLRDRGTFNPALHRQETRSPRWIQQLRAFDALEAGASAYDIASALFPDRASSHRWREDDPLRSTIRRLLINARNMVTAGYRRLLR